VVCSARSAQESALLLKFAAGLTCGVWCVACGVWHLDQARPQATAPGNGWVSSLSIELCSPTGTSANYSFEHLLIIAAATKWLQYWAPEKLRLVPCGNLLTRRSPVVDRILHTLEVLTEFC
jgi:hypothetical protein